MKKTEKRANEGMQVEERNNQIRISVTMPTFLIIKDIDGLSYVQNTFYRIFFVLSTQVFQFLPVSHINKSIQI